MGKNRKLDKYKEGYSRTRFFVSLMSIVIIIASSIVLLMYQQRLGELEQHAQESEAIRVEAVAKQAVDTFRKVGSDIKILSKHNELQEFIETGSEESLKHLEQEFLIVGKEKKVYAQVRFVDKSGKERVRVDVDNGEAELVAEKNLQNKKERYYFKDTMALEEGEVFVSPFDLNIENGKVEQPYNPMLRFATPVVDSRGRAQGIVIINYQGEELIYSLDRFAMTTTSYLSVLNQEGYWLKAEQPEKEWGFMFNNKKEVTFKKEYPEAWRQIKEQQRGVIETKDSFFVHQRTYPLVLEQVSSTGTVATKGKSIQGEEYYWDLVTRIPKVALRATAKELLLNLLIVSGALVLIIGVGLWILADTIAGRMDAEKHTIELNGLLKIVNKILRHDILGKLTGIKAQLEVYREMKNEESLDYIEEATHGGIALVQQMKALESLIMHEYKPQKICIHKTLEAIKKEYKTPITIKGEGVVLADQALTSVLENIIRNAIVHGKTKKVQTVIQQKEEVIEVRIIDEGVGIIDEIKEKIFEEGFKSGPTAHTGIGLYIVKQTITRYKGTVHVEDNKPKGSIFVLRIPRG